MNKKPAARPAVRPAARPAAPVRQVINNRGNFGPTPGMKTEPPKMGAVPAQPVPMPQKKVPLGMQSQVMGLGGGDMYGMGKAPMAPGIGGTFGGMGQPRGMKKGGKVKSGASKRADGVAQRGKTKGRFV